MDDYRKAIECYCSITVYFSFLPSQKGRLPLGNFSGENNSSKYVHCVCRESIITELKNFPIDDCNDADRTRSNAKRSTRVFQLHPIL